jgi:outer membrane protein
VSAGIQAEQTLFDGFRMQNTLRSARMEAARGRASADSTVRAIAMDAIGAYTDLLYADNLVALQTANRDFANSQLRIVQVRFDLGEGTLGELSYARAQALSAATDLETAKGAYDEARARYERVFETAPGKIAPIPATNRCLPSSMEAAVALGLQKAPEIAEARADANKAMYDFHVAEGGRLPTIKLTASVNSDSSLDRTVSNGLPGVNLSRTSSLNASAGVKLTVPLYDGGNTKSAIREARETYYQKKYNSDYVAREIEKNIRSAYIAMDVARQNLTTMKNQYQSISKFFYATVREYEIGEKNLDDIYDAQFQKVSVEDRILASERDFLNQAYIVQMFSGCL